MCVCMTTERNTSTPHTNAFTAPQMHSTVIILQLPSTPDSLQSHDQGAICEATMKGDASPVSTSSSVLLGPRPSLTASRWREVGIAAVAASAQHLAPPCNVVDCNRNVGALPVFRSQSLCCFAQAGAFAHKAKTAKTQGHLRPLAMVARGRGVPQCAGAPASIRQMQW
jgi:hypothetical protein